MSGSAGISLGLHASAQAQGNVKPAPGIAPASVKNLAPIPAAVPSEARIAIERGRQLEAQGIPALAAVQFRTAVDSAPKSIDAARELARFYVRQNRTEDTADAWRGVLFLNRNDAEATAGLAKAQSQLLVASDALPFAGGQSRVAVNTTPIAGGTPAPKPAAKPAPAPAAKPKAPVPVKANNPTNTVGVAQTAPRLAQSGGAPEGGVADLPDAPVTDIPAPDLSVDLANPAPPASAIDPAPPIPVPAPPIVAPKPPAPEPVASAGFTPPRVSLPAPVGAQPTTYVTAVTYQPAAKTTPKVSAATAAKAWPLVNKAAKELAAGRTQNALKLYQSAFKLDPANQYAGPGVGTSYIVLGRFTDASAAYRKFLAAKPGDLTGLRGLADSLTYALKYREALGVNNAILAKKKNDFAASYQNAQITTYLRAYAQSDKFFNIATAANPKNAEAWAAWGESLTYRRDARAQTRFNKALALNPKSARALTGLGNYLAYNNQFESAIPRYRASLAVRPNDVATQVALADALTYTSNQNAALPYYKTALAKEPNNKNARLGYGRALVYSGQSEAGASELRRVLSVDPGNYQALEALALAQADMSPSAAIESYQTLLSRQTGDVARARTLASIGDLQARNNNFEKAIEAYSQASRLAPNDSKINLGYAQLLASQEQFAAARPVIARVLSTQPENAQALALQVQVENRAGNPEDARALAAKLETVRPASVDDALALAEALRATGNPASAKKVLDNAVATVNDPISALRLADATRDAGDYATATSLYKRILTSNPSNVEARLNYAESLIYQKDLAGAQEQIKQVLVTDPGNVEAKVLTATISLRADTPAAREEANRQANAILANDPNNAGAQVIVGEVLTSRSQFADAVAQFRKAVQAEPGNLEARLGLARNLYYSRDIEASISEYRELIRRVPTDTLPRLELAQIYLDRNRFSDAEALYNEVLALRRGLPASTTARWKVETRAYAKLNPLAKMNSTLRSEKALKTGRRVVVEAPAKVAPAKATPAKVVKTAGKKGAKNRTLLAQSAATQSGSVIPPSFPATAPSTPAPDVVVPDLGTPDVPTPNSAPSTTTPAPTDTAPATDIPPTTDTPVVDVPDTTTPVVPPIDPVPTTNSLDPSVTDQVAALRGLGEIRRRQERYLESVDYFNQALTLDSTDIPARVGIAQALRGQTKYVDALHETDRVLAVDAQNIPARVLRAQLLGDTGKPEIAQQELDTLSNSLPENAPLDTYISVVQAFNTLENYNSSLGMLDEATEVYPNEPALPRLRAETLTFARRSAEAIAIYDSLISADPQDADAVLGKARVYNYSDQLPQAETTYRQVLALQPDNYQATTELADVLGRRSDFAGSIDYYGRAIASNPTDLATAVELARVQRYSGATGDAEATLNQVLDRDPRYVPALTERGILRGTLGSYAPGIADLNTALEISPTDLDAQLGLAEVQGYAGDYDSSIKGYRAALERAPQNAKARTQLGAVLSYAGRPDEALKELDIVLVANPTDISARLTKADVLGRAQRTKESVALYNQILASDPKNIRARTGLADAYLYGQQYGEAIKVYDALIAADPTTSSYKVQRARALAYSGRNREAIQALRQVVQSEPNNLPARLALAEAGTNSGDPSLLRDAVADYRQILATEPSNVTAQIGLGRALSYKGSYKESKQVLNTVLQTSPENVDARTALAETQRFNGQSFDAQKNYRQVLKTQPNNSVARNGLRAARRDTAPLLTTSYSYYTDTNGVRLRSLNYGATIPTKALTLGVIAQKGRFSQGGIERDRNALSLLLARNFGPVQARLILTKLRYDGAPRRTLYDFLLNNVRSSRERYYAGILRRDVFESNAAVAAGITATLYRAGFAYPLARHWDLEGQVTQFDYSDGNDRTLVQPSIMYRFKPTTPSLRVGLTYMYDDASFFTPNYYSPQNFNAASILADYVVEQGKTRWGVTGAYALTNSTGDGGINRPADTLFGYINQDIGDHFELFAQGGLVRTPTFRSNQISGGVNLRF